MASSTAFEVAAVVAKARRQVRVPPGSSPVACSQLFASAAYSLRLLKFIH